MKIHLFNLQYLKEDIPIELRRSQGSAKFLLESWNFTSERVLLQSRNHVLWTGGQSQIQIFHYAKFQIT
mgnify:CR=1 FL=1